MKNKKTVFGIIIAVIVITIAVTAAIIYKKELAEIIAVVKDKIVKLKNRNIEKCEFADYEDVSNT